MFGQRNCLNFTVFKATQKRIIMMTFVRFLSLALLSVAMASTLTVQADTKYASIVIDLESDEVLHARHADEPRYPASLTKVMTLYLLFDEIKAGRMTLNTPLPVSKAAASAPPSKLGLRAGSTITVGAAIDALVTKSANDVAVVVAEKIGGSESRFAALMTVKARSLGMSDTLFYNASGLPDPRQVSTARDMAMLAEAILYDHADYYHYFSQTKFIWGRTSYKNHNKLLGRVDGVDGIKTGYTRASGFNLMASATRDGRRVIAIMLGGKTSKARDGHVTALLEAAFDDIKSRQDDPERLRMITENRGRLSTAIAFGSDYFDDPVGEFNADIDPVGEGDAVFNEQR